MENLDTAHLRNVCSIAACSKPRTVIVTRKSLNSTFGFALQSYVFQRKGETGELTEQLTYVDYVGEQSPSEKAGIRKGDVILSINGLSTLGQSHSSLVTFINSLLRMKLVLLFQNITKIVQLSTRSIQLRYILREKEIMVKMVELEERKLIDKSKLPAIDDLSLEENKKESPANTPQLSFSTMQWPPSANPPKPGSISDRYDKFISKWPKIHSIHRMVVDGSRWCFSDIKTYYNVKKDLRSGKKINELSFPELEVLVQTPAEGPKMMVVLTLLPLPFTVYIIGFAIIFFPRYVLTRHFWTDLQRKDFFSKDINKSMEYSRNSATTFAKPLSSIKSNLDDIALEDLIALRRFQGCVPLTISPRNSLNERAMSLKELDSKLHKKLDTLTSQQLYFHMFIRRLTYNNLTDEEIKAKLKKWISFSANLTNVQYLMAPHYLNQG